MNRKGNPSLKDLFITAVVFALTGAFIVGTVLGSIAWFISGSPLASYLGASILGAGVGVFFGGMTEGERILENETKNRDHDNHLGQPYRHEE